MHEAGVALPAEPGLPTSDDPYPPSLTISMDKVDTLRYGENPHQPAARYRRTDREPRPAEGPFASGEPPLQGKALSYNNVLDASAAASLARLMRGPAVVIVKHTNPCGAAERPTLLEAWESALAGDPVSAFGGVVAVTGTVDRALGERLVSIFLEVVVAPAFDEGAREVLATKANLRLVVDPGLAASADRGGVAAGAGSAADYLGSFRTAGGAVLVTAPDNLPDDPSTWACTTSRTPTDAELRDLDLAWRVCRGVVSNGIVLVRGGMLVGVGSGQVSRVDACRGAVDKARQFQGEAGAIGAVAASDAFFPFADGPKVLLDAGVTAIVQPGGSMRDAEVLAEVEAAGAAMLVTGTRHFRH
jgi:phosphoribosylaminoimidazolecarboxamide formyltransferase/IMP cyclohydrolase